MDQTGAPALAAAVPTPEGGRVQLALNVDDLDAAVAFYSALFGTPPAKLRPGYAGFSLATPPLKLVLQEAPGRGGTLDHLGIEVPDSETVRAETRRLGEEGLLTTPETATTCCYASQDKVWVTAPSGERWEVYTVLADSETYGPAPGAAVATPAPAACC